MKLRPTSIDRTSLPDELQPFLYDAELFDSSCSSGAKVVFIDKEEGYFLKTAPAGSLREEAALTKYFYNKGLSAEVITYVTEAEDWLLTAKIPGEDCAAPKHLGQPERLVDIFAEQLHSLHNTDFSGCPVTNHTEGYLATARCNHSRNQFNKNLLSNNGVYGTVEEAFSVLDTKGQLLKTDTLLHGDYCLPNIILRDWKFSGFIDLGKGGIGDRHVDLYWALWTLAFNLKTDQYHKRFLDAYGKNNINEELFEVVAAVEIFS